MTAGVRSKFSSVPVTRPPRCLVGMLPIVSLSKRLLLQPWLASPVSRCHIPAYLCAPHQAQLQNIKAHALVTKPCLVVACDYRSHLKLLLCDDAVLNTLHTVTHSTHSSMK